jgi:CubicO group peptidase (beta-lactamase class C family)
VSAAAAAGRAPAPGGAPGADAGMDAGMDEGELRERLAGIRAPDAVLAVSRAGRHTVVSGGTAARPAGRREGMRYELGSLTKTFTVLLLARLERAGAVGLDDPLVAHLPGPPPPHPYARRITLRHLATHTSGLPRLPRDLVPAAVLRPYGGYTGYGYGRLLNAFARARPWPAPGTRWRYSNFGAALLGAALAHAAGTDFGSLLTEAVLRPLGLADTGLTPRAADATGHRPDGRTPLPRTEAAAFAPATGLRAGPADLLRYAEAHLDPRGSPLADALRRVRAPVLRRGFGQGHTHTLAWFVQPAHGGPLLFHAGATFGQQAFLGYHPASGTAVAAAATRHDRSCRVITTGHTLLHDLAAHS